VASNPYGCLVVVEVRSTAAEDIPSSRLQRSWSYNTGRLSVTDLLARRLFDACPEADVVDV
jgi:hypothetical protein